MNVYTVARPDRVDAASSVGADRFSNFLEELIKIFTFPRPLFYADIRLIYVD
jgi:hypothetical protein